MRTVNGEDVDVAIVVDYEHACEEWWDSAHVAARVWYPVCLRAILIDGASRNVVGRRVAADALEWCRGLPGWDEEFPPIIFQPEYDVRASGGAK